MFSIHLCLLLVSAWVVSANFVSTQNGKFVVNGQPFTFVGTNAYYLHTLNDIDIDYTLGNLSANNIRVIRTWAFNDVEEIPSSGPWFQLITKDAIKINDGPNGLQRLDTVLKLAKKHNIYVSLTLTNNWNPFPRTTPRNTLSNDYGGMDVYVRNFGKSPKHDEFYTNDKILTTFKNYVHTIVKRYADNQAVFAWELANDPRCSSTLPASPECTPQTITKWHAEIAGTIKSWDPNHLISSGNHGFFCLGCPKLFPLKSHRSMRREELQTRSYGAVFDGSFGIDSEDILNIPQISFSSSQLFPDQFKYGQPDSSLPPFNQTVQVGVDWIKKQGALANIYGKPIVMQGFGLVTKENVFNYVPFDSSQAPFSSSSPPPPTFGVTDSEQNYAFNQWFQAGFQSGMQGLAQYQLQSNVTKSGSLTTRDADVMHSDGYETTLDNFLGSAANYAK